MGCRGRLGRQHGPQVLLDGRPPYRLRTVAAETQGGAHLARGGCSAMALFPANVDISPDLHDCVSDKNVLLKSK